MRSASRLLTLTITFTTPSHSGGTELLLAPPRSKRHTIEIPRLVPALSGATSDSLQEPSITSPETNGAATAAAAAAEDKKSDMRYLIRHIRENMIVEREELFVDADGQGV